MASGDPPVPKKKTGAVTATEALNQMAKNWPKLQLPKETQEAFGKLAIGAQIFSIPPRAFASSELEAPSSADEIDPEALKGGVVGGREDKPRRRGNKRSTQGKSLLHSGDRTVRVYKVTEDELERLGSLARTKTQHGHGLRSAAAWWSTLSSDCSLPQAWTKRPRPSLLSLESLRFSAHLGFGAMPY